MPLLIFLIWFLSGIALWRVVWAKTAHGSWGTCVMLRSLVITWMFAPTLWLDLFPLPFLAAPVLVASLFPGHVGKDNIQIAIACFVVSWGVVAIIYDTKYKRPQPDGRRHDAIRRAAPAHNPLAVEGESPSEAPAGRSFGLMTAGWKQKKTWQWGTLNSLLVLTLLWVGFEAVSPPVSYTTEQVDFFVHGPQTTHLHALRAEKEIYEMRRTSGSDGDYWWTRPLVVNKWVLFLELGTVVTALGVAALRLGRAQGDGTVSDRVRAGQMLAGSALVLHCSVVLLPLAGKGADTIWILQRPLMGLLALPALLPSIFAAWIARRLFRDPQDSAGRTVVSGWATGILLVVATIWTLLLITDLVPAISNGFLGGFLLGVAALWLTVAAVLVRGQGAAGSA